MAPMPGSLAQPWAAPAALAAALLVASPFLADPLARYAGVGGGQLASLSAHTADIPVVDVAPLLTAQGGSDRAAARAQLAAAAREVGVVRVVGHGVDDRAARKAGNDYFALPLDVKACNGCSLRNASTGLQRGYIPFAAESGLASVTEVKEGFCYGLNRSLREPQRHPHQVPNVWPPSDAVSTLGGQAWMAALTKLFDDSVRVSVAAVDALAEALGAERGGGLLPSLRDGGETISQMRLFRYLPAPPPSPEAGPQRFMGSSPHTDWHLVTVIWRDEGSVLQFRDRRRGGFWTNVTHEPGELVLLVGDWLSAFSSGDFHSATHRVLLPEVAKDSLSFVFFFYPSPEARLPSRQPVDTGGGAGVAPPQAGREEFNTVEDSMFQLPWGDYLVRKWAKVMSNR